MTREALGLEPAQFDAKTFFGRPGKDVLNDWAYSWIYHTSRNRIHNGKGGILALQLADGIRYFNVALGVFYDSSSTMKRFSSSRGPEIEQLEPGTMIGFNFHKHKLVFIKTQKAANIQLAQLEEVDIEGNPVTVEQEMSAARIGALVGLENGESILLEAFSIRNRPGFLLDVTARNFVERIGLDDLEQRILG
ncbi:hypothetical protein A2866_01945 [Candidatus Roizmanbacteria bacterium RIFCSPHIGHO2_01_FULL_39_8]|uniref:Uncharacterized protein n=3 Tax=Candidatus Roizmaniibacteriota TaxID=1752723 RepID=A0A1F7GPY8_9BACT|nr:MAG: hypothetical protein A2866_01945 [Candidatus Roizmanbacteria bacterium RIFCSPHIGHO2_01_FULL_39_8]OGK28173.1 MAG: hypothetical protein A3C28_02455 [Candidatus Roizmanbacteria bacterium RIFCSPHIGHO2_02_FULL_39_9]OGK37868.1 MAG: hypothetical protein A3F60_03330 [Candidatus Roizmanbacteria bacterium RIFCSPHIGHO2_12_FULL_39_8]